MSKIMGLGEKRKVASVKNKLVKRNPSIAIAYMRGKLKGHFKTSKAAILRRRYSSRIKFVPRVKSRRHAAHCELKRNTCQMCGNLFSPRASLEDPSGPSQIFENCDKCTTILTSDLPLHADQVLQCKLCSELFTSDKGLKLHLSLHANQVLQCKVCSELFTTEKALKLHSRDHQKRFKCSVCGRLFATEISFKAHMEGHEYWKPHQCDVCSKRFFHESALEEHSHKHVHERHLKCDVCGKVCLYLGGLMLHLSRHSIRDSIGLA